MEIQEFIQSLSGPAGLTTFTLIMIWFGGKWVHRLVDERIFVYEKDLKECREDRAIFQGNYTELKEQYGYLKGKIEILLEKDIRHATN